MNFTKYLGIPHNYNTMNCLLFLKKIYEEELNLDFPSLHYKLSDVQDIRYLRRIPIENILTIDGWVRKNLTELKDYDILVFKDSRLGRVRHFGMYIGNNKFIHLPENSVSHISDLDETYRKSFAGAVRHKILD